MAFSGLTTDHMYHNRYIHCNIRRDQWPCKFRWDTKKGVEHRFTGPRVTHLHAADLGAVMADCTEFSMGLRVSEAAVREVGPQPLSFLGRCWPLPRWILLPLQSALPTGRSRAVPQQGRCACPFAAPLPLDSGRSCCVTGKKSVPPRLRRVPSPPFGR